MIPTSAEDQARYVSEAQTEFERVARLWEVEDANRLSSIHRYTTQDIGRERMAVINQLLNQVGAE